MKPNAYLWQAGIAKFYLGDLEGAADIFARNAETFESKFGPASEERIWRDACELRLLSSMSRKERKHLEEPGSTAPLLRAIPIQEMEGSIFASETRKVFRLVRDLFSASVKGDHGNVILARARLHSIGGRKEKNRLPDQKMWKLNSWFYLGLHYDAIDQPEESKQCMKMALRLCSNGHATDIIHTLPLLHMAKRDWFDDDDYLDDELATVVNNENDADSNDALKQLRPPVWVQADPLIVASIKKDIRLMKFEQLQDALHLRGLKINGSKESLQERLFFSLLDDAGYISGSAN